MMIKTKRQARDDREGVDEFLAAAIAEAKAGLDEGGIPIGSVLVHKGAIIGRGADETM